MIKHLIYITTIAVSLLGGTAFSQSHFGVEDSLDIELNEILKGSTFSKSKYLCDSIGQAVGVESPMYTKALLRKAWLCVVNSQSDSALFFSQRVQKLNLTYPIPALHLAEAVRLEGIVAQMSDDYSMAKEKYFESLGILDPVPSLFRGGLYANIAHANSGIDLDSAIFYQKKSLADYKVFIEDTAALNNYYSEIINLAKYYYVQRDYELAKSTLQNVLNPSTNDSEEMSETTRLYALDLLAAFYRREGNFKEAELVGLEMEEIAERTGSLSQQKTTYNSLYYTYYDQEKWELALDYLNYYLVVSDSLMNQEKISEINKLRVQYESEKKDANLKLAKAQLNEQIATAKRNRLINRTIIGVIIVILAITVLIIFNYRQKQRIANQKIELSNQRVDVLLSEQEVKTKDAALQGQEAERQRISRDLHDQLGGLLATIKLQFQSPDAPEISEKTLSLIDQASTEVRRISHDLAAGTITQFGLIPALDDLCTSLNQSGTIEAELNHFGLESRLPQKVELQLYRVIQELTSNVLKHAKAQNISISLTMLEDELNILFEDDGKGMKMDPNKKPGIGLLNMQERMAQINGTLTFDSYVGRGTTANISLPL